MKRITLLSIALIIFFTTNAQLFNIGGFGIGYLYVGPKLGGNMSFMTVDAPTGSSKKANFGYQFGGVAKFGITKKLSIQPELNITSKGTKFDDDFATSSTNYRYLGLPVVVKYAFLAVSGIQLYGSGGFYTDYMTGGKSVYKSKEEGIDDHSHSIEDFSSYNRVDFGFNIGGGANIPLKNKDQLNIDLRYVQGIVDIQEQSTSSSSKNISIQLSAVYLVDLTKWVNFKGKSIFEEDAYEENTAPAGRTKVEREEN